MFEATATTSIPSCQQPVEDRLKVVPSRGQDGNVKRGHSTRSSSRAGRAYVLPGHGARPQRASAGGGHHGEVRGRTCLPPPRRRAGSCRCCGVAVVPGGSADRLVNPFHGQVASESAELTGDLLDRPAMGDHLLGSTCRSRSVRVSIGGEEIQMYLLRPGVLQHADDLAGRCCARSSRQRRPRACRRRLGRG